VSNPTPDFHGDTGQGPILHLHDGRARSTSIPGNWAGTTSGVAPRYARLRRTQASPQSVSPSTESTAKLRGRRRQRGEQIHVIDATRIRQLLPDAGHPMADHRRDMGSIWLTRADGSLACRVCAGWGDSGTARLQIPAPRRFYVRPRSGAPSARTGIDLARLATAVMRTAARSCRQLNRCGRCWPGHHHLGRVVSPAKLTGDMIALDAEPGKNSTDSMSVEPMVGA